MSKSSSLEASFIDSGPYLTEGSTTRLFIRQLDQPDVITGGNKSFKLKYNLLKARQEGYTKLLTFGGMYSNHIAATARLGSNQGFETLGILRGDKSEVLNNTIKRAINDGMEIIYFSREDYKKKDDQEFLQHHIKNLNEYYVIPEGGANAEGVLGCKEILTESDNVYDYFAIACGTATTASGMLMQMKSNQKLIGISVLKDNGFLEKNIDRWFNKMETDRICEYKIFHEYDFGGYAKSSPELLNFIEKFNIEKNIQIEPVYTGKMFFGLNELLNQNYFPEGSSILAIHTGGLQYLLEQ